MLYQNHNQSMVFSQKMAQNLSILQMNRTLLNILVDRLSRSNPLIDSKNYFVPWKNSIDPSTITDSLSQEQNLFDILREELMLDISTDDYPLLYLIIGNLNAQGFLEHAVEKLLVGTNFDSDRLLFIYNKIKHSSFKGLGCRNSKEYLLFIIEDEFGIDSLEYNIVKLLTKSLRKKNITADFISEILKEPLEKVNQALIAIKKKPITPLIGNNIKTIYPDFYIHKSEDELIIEPSKYMTPTIEIKDYHNISYSQKQLNFFLKEGKRIQSALELRKTALQKHAEALILKRKDFFFEDSDISLKVQLKDISEITGRHISTVSRSLKERYFMFDKNIYPFSILWTNSIGDFSVYRIKKIINEILLTNNSMTALSDNTITEILRKKGISIARRTVNKYRKELEINSLYNK